VFVLELEFPHSNFLAERVEASAYRGTRHLCSGELAAGHPTQKDFADCPWRQGQTGNHTGEPNMAFKNGDKVKWSSSAQGSWKEKTGVVVTVVQAGVSPKLVGSGWPREHESYVVEVAQGTTGKAKPKLYWPRVTALALVD
jgi:hypothetical protein